MDPKKKTGIIPKKKIRKFQKRILSAYRKSGRDLPWRRTSDSYEILISEIMLQQTQADRVISYFERWLLKWPTIHDLASAKRSDVLEAWLGLGYNNRAKNLHECAKIISEQFRGDVISAMPHYKQIPGIGPYTSCAVRIFSSNEDIVTVDTNIRRILISEFGLDESIPEKELWAIAEKCLPKGKSREWHNALMDYGANELTSRKSGIRPKTSQSKFEGSDRQIRARILRLLLGNKEKGLDLESARSSLLRLGMEKRDLKDKRLGKILAGLMKNGLAKKKGKNFFLAD